MVFLLRFFIVMSLLTSIQVVAQTFQYQVEGSFTSGDDLPDTEPVIVTYTLKWNETPTDIQGIYLDNYYSNIGPKAVTGTIDSLGRNFNIILPEVVNDVKSITMKLSQLGAQSGSIPMHIETFNNINVRLVSVNTFAFISQLTTPPVTDTSCTVGFGVLTGLCGSYAGRFNELTDSQNRCDLLSGGEPRLVLGADTNFTLYLNYAGIMEGLPFHSLGTFITSPQSARITTERENCGALPGTRFDPANCQTLSLEALFFEGPSVNVSGTYVIKDQVTDESCSYSFYLTREVQY